MLLNKKFGVLLALVSPCSIWLVITQIVGTMFNHIQVLAHCTYTCTYIKTSGFSGFQFYYFLLKFILTQIPVYSGLKLVFLSGPRLVRYSLFGTCFDYFFYLQWLPLSSFSPVIRKTHTHTYTYIFIDYNCVLCYLNKKSLWLSHELRVYFFLSMSYLFLPLTKT